MWLLYGIAIFGVVIMVLYTQYAVILKRQKNFDKLAVINAKRDAEGWGKGDDY
ncbi:hypothetical protein [Gilliamella sp. Pas-s25]|uniref:hypothetical protein n=1 Tax=Gilliamella sp. Pas-s25 TaxID=2687310 RepID=UPI00135DD3C0|nr:hypothetical protein [Gilliamella sp. Pas-s25]MWP63272.1 hypothetical protein [Gilliamella sp. Pas-s25]